jgi:sugar transferase (PEP-CTERM/EpsH1 system associated)
MDQPRPPVAPLIAHVILRLAVGGMENGMVNLINRTPPGRYRHAVICLDDADDFKHRITQPGVNIIELGKKPGKDFGAYGRLWRALRRLNPAVVHTRNLPAIDMVVPAYFSGRRHIVHGEHGRDMLEIAGDNRKYNLVRKLVSPFVDQYITVSRDLESWLGGTVGIAPRKITQIYNGVDCARFHPPAGRREAPPVENFAGEDSIIIGTVGRMEDVKDQITLATAFIALHQIAGRHADRIRLMMIGDGGLRPRAQAMLTDAGLENQVWLPGDRNDIPGLLRAMDLFVLPSRNEGISNTILEAMACGLPVIATAVGGNVELVTEGETGALIPPGDPQALAQTLKQYLDEPRLITHQGKAARTRAENLFDLDVMVKNYLSVYDDILAISC